MTKTIRLGIIGTGNMGHHHAREFSALEGCALVAACDRDRERAEALAEEYDIPHVYTGVAEMLAGADLDAVVIVTPDDSHAPIALEVIAAGKHVLCEKPLAEHAEDARRMAEAAAKAGVINMVNFTYRRSPALQKARALVAEGRLGRIVDFEAHYLQSWLTSKIWGDWATEETWLWRLSTAHGSQGVLGDIGVHILDLVSFPAGDYASVQCRLKTFPKAEGDRIGAYRLDANDSAFITAELTNGAMGVIHASRWATGYRNALALSLHGDKGALRFDLEHEDDVLEVCLGDDVDTVTWRTIRCEKTPTNAERFLESIRTGRNDQPDFARGAAIQAVIDACFRSDAEGRAMTL
ncbi:Gfo/Idh/MocA family protein [Rhodocaloribacter sp.]